MALNIDQSGSFPRVATKRKTKVSVGFEWEVPAEMQERECECYDHCDCEDGDCWCACDCDGEDEHVDLSDTTCRFMDTHGFRTHYECGGAEFASPVFGNITTARRVAKAIKEVALQDRSLGEDTNPSHCCGIHVHTSHVDLTDRWETRDTYLRVSSMLHRKSSAEFIFAFSGRKKDKSYSDQAISLCWDDKGEKTPSSESTRRMGYRQMVRPNEFGRSHTIEYRLWHTAEDRLLPAIDFAHACTTFIMTRKDIPYLKDFKTWLDKQSGYKILKQDDAWRLL